MSKIPPSAFKVFAKQLSKNLAEIKKLDDIDKERADELVKDFSPEWVTMALLSGEWDEIITQLEFCELKHTTYKRSDEPERHHLEVYDSGYTNQKSFGVCINMDGVKYFVTNGKLVVLAIASSVVHSRIGIISKIPEDALEEITNALDKINVYKEWSKDKF